MTSPLISRYAVRGLMSPFGRRAPVTLGRRNAERNPRRTSATASALMISLALVSGLVVIAASAKASVDQSIADAIGTSELVVTQRRRHSPFSSQVRRPDRRVPGVASVHRVRQIGRPGRRHLGPGVRSRPNGTLAGPITSTVEAGSLQRPAERPGDRCRATWPGHSTCRSARPSSSITTTGTHQLTVGRRDRGRTANSTRVVLSLPEFRRGRRRRAPTRPCTSKLPTAPVSPRSGWRCSASCTTTPPFRSGTSRRTRPGSVDRSTRSSAWSACCWRWRS